MNSTTHSPTKQDLSNYLRQSVNRRIIKKLQANEPPWQKPWIGRGKGLGFHRNIAYKSKFFGINAILLQMAAREKRFCSNLWGTSGQFAKLGMPVKDRPDEVETGNWGTEIVFYNDNIPSSIVVYNLEQTQCLNEGLLPNPILAPDYSLVEKVLHATSAKVEYNREGKAFYFYNDDYITIPAKEDFEIGLGGLPGYYDALAHELIHWTEPRLGFRGIEPIIELRAEIGASLLMEELSVPNSIAYMNFNKWRNSWISLMESDPAFIFRIAASACRAVDYILTFSLRSEKRFNQIDENAA
jgi:antirestriction protein ArdC